MVVKNLIILGVFALALLIIGCNGPTGSVVQDSSIVLESDGQLPADFCLEQGLNDNVIMLESQYCGHCKIAVPIFKEIAKENNVNVEILDVSKDEDRATMENYGINIKYTPTLVAGCNVFIGGKSKEEYVKIIDEFVKKR